MAHALTFGASGVSGWAIARQALEYPEKSSFRTVTALTNRPLSLEDSAFPKDDRLQLVSGIDLTGPVDTIVAGLRSKVKGLDTVSHVFFTAYIEKPEYPELVSINTDLVRNAITAVDKAVGSTLQTVVLQTGGKYYGVEFADKVRIEPPLKEDTPRLGRPLSDNIFYYPQYDVVKELSEGKAWKFYEVRPDVIVGFTPGSNFMNITQGLGFYLALFKEVYGEGAKVPFVGTHKSWVNKHTDTFQDILAHQEIHIALNCRNIPSGTSFNAADGDVVTWEQKWPKIAEYFGLEGVGPGSEPTDVGAFATQHETLWRKLETQYGLRTGIFEKYSWGFVKGVCVAFDFDRQYDLSASRRYGFSETVPAVQGFITALDRMRVAKIIP